MTQKQAHRRLAAKLIGFALATLLSTQSQAACSLSSSWEPWEPYQYQDKETLTGLDVELVQAIFKQADCKISYKKRPWARALKEIESGATDFVSGASLNEERQQYANFSTPYRDETMVLMVRKGEVGKYSLEKLSDIVKADFKLGIVRDFFYGDEHQKSMEDEAYSKKVSIVNSDTANLKKLLAGRVDGILIDRYTGPFLAKQEGAGNKIELHPLKVSSSDIFLMFSKKSVPSETIEKVNTALEAIKQNGTYQAILNRYLE